MNKNIYDKLDKIQREWQFPDACFSDIINLIKEVREEACLKGFTKFLLEELK